MSADDMTIFFRGFLCGMIATVAGFASIGVIW